MSEYLCNSSPAELQRLYDEAVRRYETARARGLKLDMSRGKPASAQLDICNGAMSTPDCWKTEEGFDARNYGLLAGLVEMRKFFAGWLEIDADSIIVGGNSSLNMMYDTIVRFFVFGTLGNAPWKDCKNLKFLCPSPGYDRHFAITQEFGFEMITVPMTPTGPDMDVVEALVKDDPGIKGIWCVPLYSNPQGICYSDETVDRLAKMQCAAPDFRIFWDNAYGVHHLYGENKLKNILASCAAAGNPERACYFFSTSKITFPGGGVAMMAVGPESRKELLKRIGVQTIGSDKLNQLRTLNFLKNPENARRHMEKIAASLRPKFETVLEILERELGGTGLAVWNKPQGGYFVAVDTIPGCAKEVVKMAAEAGVVMTGAGATFPYGKDPNDSNIRIAPSFPTVEELACAMELFCICVRMVCIKKLMQSK
ncbi:MAG: aminotransferase class I/II-fold pyridoxal phosphate-dependent enzyme [Lentisphaeria bacterium]|nr:aminotransferase class I/II-fold pyridoxal phosphate-dependent enzyme [Lentisphaeria bacterium]